MSVTGDLPMRSAGTIRLVETTGRNAMREIQASEAKTQLPRLLTDVEAGETIVITRHGRPIARLAPMADDRASRIAKLKQQLSEFRKSMPRLTVEEILSARDEGRRG